MKKSTTQAALALALPIAFACLLAATPARAQDTANDTVRRAVHVCEACHGEAGRAKDASMPTLNGQMPRYIERQLKDFRSQARSEASSQAYMWGVSALLDDTTIAGLAEYYAAQPTQPARAGKPANPRQVALGRKIFDDGIEARGVRACSACHGSQAEGDAGFPRLAGQSPVYVRNQLKLFRNTPLRQHGVLMKKESRPLDDAEVRAVAAYLQTL
jgi:cytochrome c553